jgi:spore coat protein CotH
MKKDLQRLLKKIRLGWKRYIQSIMKINGVDIDHFKKKY